MTGTEIERLIVRLVGDSASFQKMIDNAIKDSNRAARQIESAGKRIEAVGTKLRGFGRSVSLYVTAPLLGLGALAIKAGADFDSGFAGVRKTVNASASELAVLRQGFKDLAGDIPIAVDELLRIGELAGQLGIANDNILSFTRTIADLTVTTNLTAEEAATDLARFANITNMPQKQFSNLGSSIVALGNTTATTERDIVSMSMRLAGAGKTVGLSIPQITGMAAALSEVGLEAEMGGTAFSRLMLDIATAVATGNDQLGVFADVAGMTSNEFSKQFRDNAAGAIESLLNGINQLDQDSKIQAIEAMGIEGARLTDAVLRASGAVDKFGRALSISEIEFAKNTALAKEAAERYKTFWSQITLLRNNLKGLFGEMFEAAEPTIRSVINSVSSFIDWMKTLSKETKSTLLIIGAIAAAVGPLLVAFGGLIWSLGQVVKGFQMAKTAGGALLSFRSKLTSWLNSLSSAKAATASTSASMKTLANTTTQTANVATAGFTRIGQSSRTMAMTVSRSATAASLSLLGLQRQILLLTGTVQAAQGGASVVGVAGLLTGPTVKAAQAATTLDVEFKKVTTTSRALSGAQRLAGAALEKTKSIMSKALAVAGAFKLELILLATYGIFKGIDALGMFGKKAEDASVQQERFNAVLKAGNKILDDQLAKVSELAGVNKEAAEAELKQMEAAQRRADARATEAQTRFSQLTSQGFGGTNMIGFSGFSAEAQGKNSEVDSLRDLIPQLKEQADLQAERVEEAKRVLAGATGGQASIPDPKTGGFEASKQAVDELTKSLNDQLAAVGMTSRQVDIYKLKIDEVTRSQLLAKDAQITAKEKAHELAENLKELNESLALEEKTFGMTSHEAEIYKFQMDGASESQLRMAKSTAASIKRMEKQESLMEKGKELTKQFRTPMEVLADREKELKEMLDAGAIGIDTHTKALKEAEQQAHKDYTADFKVTGVDAVEAGSADALARLQEYNAGRMGLPKSRPVAAPKAESPMAPKVPLPPLPRTPRELEAKHGDTAFNRFMEVKSKTKPVETAFDRFKKEKANAGSAGETAFERFKREKAEQQGNKPETAFEKFQRERSQPVPIERTAGGSNNDPTAPKVVELLTRLVELEEARGDNTIELTGADL